MLSRDFNTASGDENLSGFNNRKIRVKVVDDSDDTLKYIYQRFGQSESCNEKVVLLYLNSNPDMACPSAPASLIRFNPQKIIPKLFTENWVLPLVYGGQVDAVVWMKPEWSQHLKCGHNTFHVGPMEEHGPLFVDIPQRYYIEDGSYLPSSEMIDPVPFDFIVEDIHPVHTACLPCQNLLQFIRNRPFILDIDLDTFCVANPFVENLKHLPAEIFRLANELYGLTEEEVGFCENACTRYISSSNEATNDCVASISSKQRQKLRNYRHWVYHILSNKPLPKDDVSAESFLKLWKSLRPLREDIGQWQFVQNNRKAAGMKQSVTHSHLTNIIDNSEVGGVTDPSNSCDEFEEDIMDMMDPYDCCMFDWHYLFKGGLRDSQKPHGLPHQPTLDRLPDLIQSMQSLLGRLGNPLFITIRRSVSAEYMPKEHCREVEKAVLDSLNYIYGSSNLTFKDEISAPTAVQETSETSAKVLPGDSGMQKDESTSVPKKDIN